MRFSQKSALTGIIFIVVLSTAFSLTSRPIRSLLGMFKGWRIPYDAEVEYLESTGTQWIDTGVYGAARWVLRAKADVANVTQVLVSMDRDAYGGFYFGVLNGTWGFGGSGNNTTIAGTTLADIDANIVGVGTSTATVNDKTCSRTITSERNGDVWTLFAAGQSSFPFYGRVYFVWCYQGGVLVRDFIPVRFTNELGQTEGAMYDRVSGELFRNQGTGKFIIGPDK